MLRKQLNNEEDFQTSFKQGGAMAHVSMGNGEEILDMIQIDMNKMDKEQKMMFIKQFFGNANKFLKDIYGQDSATNKIVEQIIKEMQKSNAISTDKIADIVSHYKAKGSNMVTDVQYRNFNEGTTLNRAEQMNIMGVYGGLFDSFKSASNNVFKMKNR